MNKYQEALDFLGEYSLGCAVTNHKDNTIKVINEYRKSLQELVDKATPKKIIKIDKKDIDGVRKDYITDMIGYMCECPNCKKIFGWLSISPYCKHCGQKFDWSTENER